MGCGSYGVSSVLVGLQRVGLVGLRDAMKEAAESDLADPEAILDLLTERLAADNYFPEARSGAFRRALWREYLRYTGEDFSDFFSEVEVTLRGDPGEETDRLAEMLDSVLAEFELKPVIAFAPASEEDEEPTPRLVIGDEVIVRGCPSREGLKAAVRQSISDW